MLSNQIFDLSENLENNMAINIFNRFESPTGYWLVVCYYKYGSLLYWKHDSSFYKNKIYFADSFFAGFSEW